MIDLDSFGEPATLNGDMFQVSFRLTPSLHFYAMIQSYICFIMEQMVFISSIKESNGPTDNYAAIAQVDIQRQEPESLRKWREEQKARLEALGEQRWPHWGNESYSGANALPAL